MNFTPGTKLRLRETTSSLRAATLLLCSVGGTRGHALPRDTSQAAPARRTQSAWRLLRGHVDGSAMSPSAPNPTKRPSRPHSRAVSQRLDAGATKRKSDASNGRIVFSQQGKLEPREVRGLPASASASERRVGTLFSVARLPPRDARRCSRFSEMRGGLVLLGGTAFLWGSVTFATLVTDVARRSRPR